MPNVDDAIKFLNEINEIDAGVLPALINRRVPCNLALANHPTVQVGGRKRSAFDDDEFYAEYPFEVGFLGILNGLFGVDENQWGHIYCHYDPDEDGNVKVIRKFGRRSEVEA